MRKITLFLFAAAALSMTFGPAGASVFRTYPADCGNGARVERNSSRQLLAERAEKDGFVSYSTDSGRMKSREELRREEQEKEANSWQMLQNMELLIDRGRKPSPRHDGKPEK